VNVIDETPADGLYVVVSGPPASGKSTLAAQLAVGLGLPLLAKDAIKQALMSDLDVPNVAASRALGSASVDALIAVATEVGSGVLDSVWHRSRASGQLNRLPGQIVEVFCHCDQAVVEERFRIRAATRTVGHFDQDRTRDELWNDDTTEPVAGGWPVIRVETAVHVDVDALVAEIRGAASQSG
jgi:predicted kinase